MRQPKGDVSVLDLDSLWPSPNHLGKELLGIDAKGLGDRVELEHVEPTGSKFDKRNELLRFAKPSGEFGLGNASLESGTTQDFEQ